MHMGSTEKLLKSSVHSGTPGGKARRHRIEVDYRSALDKAHGKPDKALDLLVEPGGPHKQREFMRRQLERLAKNWSGPKPNETSKKTNLNLKTKPIYEMESEFPLYSDEAGAYHSYNLQYSVPPVGTYMVIESGGMNYVQGVLESKKLSEGNLELTIGGIKYNTQDYPGSYVRW